MIFKSLPRSIGPTAYIPVISSPTSFEEFSQQLNSKLRDIQHPDCVRVPNFPDLSWNMIDAVKATLSSK